MKQEHDVKLDRTEVSVLRWMYGLEVKVTKRNAEIRELLRLELVSVDIKKGRFRRFGHTNRQDDADWINVQLWRSMKQDTEGFSRKTLWDMCQGRWRVWACPKMMHNLE